MTRRLATALETLSVEVPAAALEAYEAALRTVCGTVGFFLDEATDTWRLDGVRDVGAGEAELIAALALAAAATGFDAELQRAPIAAEGWLARNYAGFPEQLVGRRFAVRGTHLDAPFVAGRITLVLDAGLAFGSGEHGSTRGCLRALERVAYRRPRRILDLGTGSGILAMAAALLLRRRVLATDIDPWSVRVARENAARNGVASLVRARRADGWRDRTIRGRAPYDLVFANILARPLCAMTKDLAAHLAPGGTVILSGLLATQKPMVAAAHRRCGLRLVASLTDGPWATLVMRAPAASASGAPAPSGSVRRREIAVEHAGNVAAKQPDISQLAIGHRVQLADGRVAARHREKRPYETADRPAKRAHPAGMAPTSARGDWPGKSARRPVDIFQDSETIHHFQSSYASGSGAASARGSVPGRLALHIAVERSAISAI